MKEGLFVICLIASLLSLPTGAAMVDLDDLAMDASGTQSTSPPEAVYALPSDIYVDIEWIGPYETRGYNVTGYQIYRAGPSDPLYVTGVLLATVDASTFHYRDNAVSNMTTYRYCIVALSTGGEPSYPSQPATVTVGATVPSTPTELKIIPMDGRVEATWNVPLDTGGVPFTSYNIYRANATGNFSFVQNYQTNGDVQSYPFVDRLLNNGDLYRYRVAAVNAFGEGDWIEGNATPNYAPSSITISPSRVDLLPSDGGKELVFNISWTAANRTESVVGYRVHILSWHWSQSDKTIDVGLNTSCVINGTARDLQGGVFRVAAVFTDGSESFSENQLLPVMLPMGPCIGPVLPDILLIAPFIVILALFLAVVIWVRRKK